MGEDGKPVQPPVQGKTGTFYKTLMYGDDGVLPVQVLPGLEIDLKEVFRE
jgi:hypothetical protein